MILFFLIVNEIELVFVFSFLDLFHDISTISEIAIEYLMSFQCVVFKVLSSSRTFKKKRPGGHLSFHTVSSIVFSADQVLTVVFGMGTGVSPDRIATRTFLLLF